MFNEAIKFRLHIKFSKSGLLDKSNSVILLKTINKDFNPKKTPMPSKESIF